MSGGSVSYTYTSTRCKHVGTPIFKIGDLTIGGASDHGNEVVRQTTLIVDCAASKNRFVPATRASGPIEAFVAEHFGSKCDVIELDWWDRRGPPERCTARFWQDLVKACGNGHLVVACMGGHGRTGTALASIGITHGWKVEEAIRFVRERHCPDAIESLDQIEYLCDLGGIDVKSLPADLLPKPSYSSSYLSDKKKDGIGFKSDSKDKTPPHGMSYWLGFQGEKGSR